MEQRDHASASTLRRRARAAPRRAAAASRAARIAARQDVGHQVAVRAERALRRAGRAAGVEDRRVVVGRDLGLREARCRAASPRSSARRSAPRARVAVPSSAPSRARRSRAPAPAASAIASASRACRSASTNSTFAPESAMPYSSSPPVHHALSGTAIAPSAVTAKNTTGHSGRLRIASATRSPFAHAHLAQLRRERRDRAVLRVVADALVLVGSSTSRSPCAARQLRPAAADRRRRVLPHPRRHAADVDRLHLELARPARSAPPSASASDIFGQAGSSGDRSVRLATSASSPEI